MLGCGVDVVHPRANRDLFAEVRRRGVIVGEYGWDLPGLAWRFPARNRIIAGLADAVVIVEGSARSGSLHTAAYMLELGREVLAVPGEAGRRLSAGPHLLLRDGARLCESAADVCEAIGLPAAGVAAAGPSDAGGEPDGREARSRAGDGLEARVLERLAAGRHTVDQLVGALACEARSVVTVLTLLELEGAIETDAAGAYRMTRAPVRPRYDRAAARGEKEAVPGPAKEDH